MDIDAKHSQLLGKQLARSLHLLRWALQKYTNDALAYGVLITTFSLLNCVWRK